MPEESRRWPADDSDDDSDMDLRHSSPPLAGRYPREDRRAFRAPNDDADSYTADGVTYRREPPRRGPPAPPERPRARPVPDRTYMHGEGYAGGAASRGRSTDEDADPGDWQPPGERTFMDRVSDEVASWFGDRDAVRRRRTDAALRGQYRGLGPRNYVRPDERIREDVCDRLTEDSWLDASAIEVFVAAGEVTLSGYVDSREDKHWAEECTETVSGVRHVQNNLRVKPVGDRAMTPGSDQTPV
jgi:osmotically-inducible protein OsmY